MTNAAHDDWPEEGEDWEDEPWSDEEAPADLVPCPNCGAEVYEDAERCPVCGEYVVHGSSPAWQGKPGWYVALAVLGTIAVIVVLSGLGAWL
jgi:hypothetical protein